MKTLLWFLVWTAIINTLAWVINTVTGNEPHITPTLRLLDALFVIGLGVWAAIVLARKS